jgi:peptide/nickel transport system substrate-binding protein
MSANGFDRRLTDAHFVACAQFAMTVSVALGGHSATAWTQVSLAGKDKGMLSLSNGQSSPTTVATRRLFRRRRRPGSFAVLAVAVALALAACSTASSPAASGGGKVVPGATVTFGIQPGSTPVYILPLYSIQFWNLSDQAELENLLYPPLYWFGKGNSPLDINESLSLAYPPVYSDNNRTITITLKSGIKWSDGQPFTSRDVEFWMNLLKANKADYGPYIPGSFPDNVTSADYPNASTVVFHLNASYNPEYFTGTELSDINPLPQHAWDKTSMSGSVGNYDMTTAGAKAVYKFLNAQSLNTASYSTSPLWKVIDGPFRLVSNTSSGNFTFEPNSSYFGPKSKIGKLVELSFTSATAENDALLSGSIDYGYLPASGSAPEIPRLEHLGYQVDPWPWYGANYVRFNYTDPATPFVKQQYVRVAMQELVNEPLLIKSIFHGYAWPDYGPVPTKPYTSFVSPSELNPMYPYDPAKAIATLRSHGWNVVPNGTTTCADPSKCGAGITKGMPLAFPDVVQPSGFPDYDNMDQAIQSSMSQAGIKWELDSLTPNAVAATLAPCVAGSPCKWSLMEDLVAYAWSPGPYPDGGVPFGTGELVQGGTAPFTPTMDALIAKARTAPSNQTIADFYNYQNYAENEVPELWIPMTYYQISVIKNTLHGTEPQNVIALMTPQSWYMTSG